MPIIITLTMRPDGFGKRSGSRITDESKDSSGELTVFLKESYKC